MEIILNLVKTNGDRVVAFARIVLGVILFAHGGQKLLGWYDGSRFRRTLEALTTYAKIPTPLAAVVNFTEFLGGFGLMLASSAAWLLSELWSSWRTPSSRFTTSTGYS